MGLGEGPPAKKRVRSQDPGKAGKGEGLDGRWMLKLVYPNAASLGPYLEAWLGDIVKASPASASASAIDSFGGPASYLSRPDDQPEFKQMVEETLVAFCAPLGALLPNEDRAPLPRYASLQHSSSMADLLDRVVRSLLRSPSTTQGSIANGYSAGQGYDPRRNVLSLGCRVAGPQAESELLSVQGVACTFPNTTVNVIRSPPWELLLSRIGDDLMFLLLRQHAVLQRLPNRCYMQLAGRPVSELCRHLGVTSSALSASVTATPKSGAVRGKEAAQPKPPNAKKKKNDDEADKRGSCEQPARSTVQRGGLSSPALYREAVENPYAVRAPSAPPPSEAGAGAASSEQPRVGNLVEKSRPSPRPMILLPRRRIFYSSTFVRKAGFPRGHSLSSCSRPQPPTPIAGERSPVLTSPLAPGDKNSKRDKGGSGAGGNSGCAASRAAYRLLFDVFFPLDSGGTQRHGHGSEGTHKSNGTGVHRSRPEVMVAGKPAKATGQGRKLPKRLRRVVPLLEEVVERAYALNFGRLLEAHCPLPQSALRRKALGQAAQGQCARAAEAGVPAVPPEPSPSPSLSDASTMHDDGFEYAEVASAWTQAGSGNGGSEEDTGSSGDEEGSMNSFSTLRDPCSQSPSLSQSPAADGVPGKRACWNGDQDTVGGTRVPSGGSVQRQRRLMHGEIPGEVCTEEDGDCVAGPTIGGNDPARAPLDAEKVEAALGGVNPVAAAVAGERGRQTNQGSPLSFGSDMTFMEMATPHRGVVDFLCQACHRMFPTELWGSKRNMVCLARAIERFVVLRRHENMSVLEVTSGMHTSDFEWMSLDAGGTRRKEPRPPPSRVLLQRDGALNAGDAASMAPAVENPDCREGSGTCNVAGVGGGTGGCEGKGSRKRRRVDGARAGQHSDHADGGISGSRLCPRGAKRKMTNGKTREKGRPRQVVGGLDKPRPGKGGGRRGGRGGGRAGSEGRQRCPPSELAKRVQLLEALVVWTFEDVIVPLLRSLFYVTECETASQEVFFFRKPVWAKFRTASLRHLTARQYRRITAHEAFRISDAHDEDEATDRPPLHPHKANTPCTQNALDARRPGPHAGGAVAGGAGGKGPGRVWAFSVSGVRLVPKANGVRAIANLSKRVWADRDCVQWVEGVPLPAPRRPVFPSNLTIASSTQSDGARAAKDTRATGIIARSQDQMKGGGAGGVARAGGAGGGAQGVGGGAGAATNARRGTRGKFGTGGGAGGSRRTLLPSTNMQLSNTFQVLKHEYHRKPTLVGAGTFGLDDVFARIKPFVSRNLRPLFSPLPRPTENCGDGGGPTESCTPTGFPAGGSAGRSPSPGAVRLAPVAAAGEGGTFSRNRSQGAGKCGGEGRRQRSELPAAGLSRPGGCGTVQQERLGGQEAARPGGRPLLYFASVDIKHCYDTVDQARLMDIVRPLVTSEDYVVQKHTKAHPFKAMGRVQVSHAKEAVAMEDMPQFQTRCEELAHGSVDTIFTDQVVYGVVSRVDVLGMIEDHVKRNVVRVPAAGASGRGAYFRQTVGIPQGSVLSGLLCNFFFGYIEKRLLGDILDPPPLSAQPPTSSVKRDVPVMNRFNGWNGDGVRPFYGRDAETAAARLSGGCFRSSPWGVGGTGARAAVGAESGCTSRLPGKVCGTAQAISDASHGEGGARSSACRSQRDHPCKTSSGERCGRDRTCGYGGGEASAGERPPFPHPEGDCTLLRQVDDFLLVTTSKEKAMAFVSTMHDQAKTGEWGFSVHEAKTKVNFDITLEGRTGQIPRQVRQIEGNTFSWCGLRFNTKTCEIMADYSRYSKSGVSESVTVESGHAGACLMGKMKRFLSPKCHGLMLDEGEFGINSRHTVLLNVYEMLLVCAAKTAASALRLPHGPAGNTSLLSNGALETTAYAYSLIQSRSNRRKGGFGTSKGLQCVCKIRRFEVTWLGLHAFREVYGAFSVKHRGFNRCKLDVHNALEVAPGSGGLEGKRQSKDGSPDGSVVRKGANTEAQQRGAYRRLLRVVRCPDALGLLHTLTTESDTKRTGR